MEQAIKGEVTQADISSASYTSLNEHCVVAQALNRMFPEKTISVGITWAQIGAQRYSIDPETQKQIANWCGYENIQPFHFTLIPSDTWGTK